MRVLLVEDEVNLANSVVALLAENGLEVIHKDHGTAGFEAALHEKFDAIILDIMLPGMNGYAICAKLRASGVTTPILMLTAKDGEYDEAEALDTGADDFLRKPFSAVVLVARVQALLRRQGARAGSLTVGDLTIDPVEHRCRRGDVEVELTPREFALLEFLLAANGAAVTKQDVVDHVWGQDFDGDLNIVEVYVGYLRKKVDRPFGRNTVETVRGIGYRVNAEA
jgi:two-component system, OmpR family, response regulator